MLEMLLEESFLMQLVQNFGYLGVIIAGFLSSAPPVPFPSPTFAVAFFAGSVLNPFFVGIAGGIGAGIGECFSYYAGSLGNKVLLKKHSKRLQDVAAKFEKYRGELLIFFFAALPLPFDFIGIFAGSVKYPFWKFFVSATLGKFVKYWTLAYLGFYSITWAAQWFATA